MKCFIVYSFVNYIRSPKKPMRVLIIALASLFLLALQFHAISGTRLLHEETMLVNTKLDLQSLQKGPVPPSERSSCTNIPGGGGPPCQLNEMHYAATFPRSAAYPLPALQFGVATNQK
ncbi:hypothetical protein ES332_D02G058000v1 [Gossypium tomentosum]|uniref:Uncharacterized protein n=1 Tax=Gossypium tomentosum TaxID=34277 RepID=A0A5D2LTL9_GOSTO|nr:hypothetical protein ES332_D02G058000v1 [Gossypium tomentosum]